VPVPTPSSTAGGDTYTSTGTDLTSSENLSAEDNTVPTLVSSTTADTYVPPVTTANTYAPPLRCRAKN